MAAAARVRFLIYSVYFELWRSAVFSLWLCTIFYLLRLGSGEIKVPEVIYLVKLVCQLDMFLRR